MGSEHSALGPVVCVYEEQAQHPPLQRVPLPEQHAAMRMLPRLHKRLATSRCRTMNPKQRQKMAYCSSCATRLPHAASAREAYERVPVAAAPSTSTACM
jgi:hypothetical protein